MRRDEVSGSVARGVAGVTAAAALIAACGLASAGFVTRGALWQPIPIPDGAVVDNPFPSNPTIVFYAFLTDPMLEINWEDGIDEQNLLGVVAEDPEEDPPENDEIAERWENVTEALALDVIPPPDETGDVDPQLTIRLLELGFADRPWGNARPRFTHPDGEAVWRWAQAEWGPVSGDNRIDFQETIPTEAVVTDETRAAVLEAMQAIERVANIVFLDRADTLNSVSQFPFQPIGSVSGELIYAGDAVRGQRRFDPDDDYPWVLITESAAGFLDAPAGGGFVTQLGPGRGRIDIDYFFDDIDGDGFPDLVNSDNPVTGLRYAPIVKRLSGNGPTDAALGDFNNDGNVDLVVANSLDNTIRVLADGPDFGTPRSPVNIGNIGTRPTAVATAFLDGDGFADAVVACSDTDNIVVLFGNDTGTLLPPTDGDPTAPNPTQEFDAGDEPIGIAVADPDLDADADVFVLNGDGNVSLLESITLAGSDRVTFDTALTFPVGANPVEMVVDDLNGDGIPDFAVANTAGTVSVYTFAGVVPLAAGSYTLDQTVNVGGTLAGIAVHDVDNDNDNDLVVTETTTSEVRVLLNDGNDPPTFSVDATRTVELEFVPGDVEARDIGDDAAAGDNPDADLFVLNPTDEELAVLLNTDGAGNFSAPQQIPLPNFGGAETPVRLLVADVGDDALVEAITINFDGDGVVVYQAFTTIDSGGPNTVVFSRNGAPGVDPGQTRADYVPAFDDANTDGIPEFTGTNLDYGDIDNDFALDIFLDTNLDGIPDSVDIDGDFAADHGSPTPIENIPISLLVMDEPTVGVAIHEWLHILGFNHEHQRPDRSDFIRVNFQNMNPAARDQFEISPATINSEFDDVNFLILPNDAEVDSGEDAIGYDFDSIMHYNVCAAAIRPDCPTNIESRVMEVLPPFDEEFDNPNRLDLVRVGQRAGLSFWDRTALIELYGAAPISAIDEDPCRADLDGDPGISVFDLFTYLEAYEACQTLDPQFGRVPPCNPIADITPPGGDGVVDFFDLLDFIIALSNQNGCAPAPPPPVNLPENRINRPRFPTDNDNPA